MSNLEAYDGYLISQLGIKRYLKGRSNQPFSNINLFQDVQKNNRQWKNNPCFGCHGTSYRALRRQATWRDTVKAVKNTAGPTAAGLIDGAKRETVDNVSLLGSGIERTAEGLHVLGDKKFEQVGTENIALANLLATTYRALVNTDISQVSNPLTQCVTLVIDRYLTAVPEWVIVDMLKKGTLEFPEGFDKHQFLMAAKQGIVELSKIEEVDKVTGMINDSATQFAAKMAGRKITSKIISAITSAIATQIAKSIMNNAADSRSIKRNLVKIKKEISSANGGLAKVLLTLLKTQGFLGLAANQSRILMRDCPATWSILRHKMNGTDMVYFLVQPMIQEYVDRLSLLEKEPIKFAKLIEALIKERNAINIFYPNAF